MLSRRIPRSTRLARVRTWQRAHSMMTVPVWRGPVENSAARPSFWLPGAIWSRAAVGGVENSACLPDGSTRRPLTIGRSRDEELAGEGPVRVGARRTGGVLEDRAAQARRLGDLDRLRHRRL